MGNYVKANVTFFLFPSPIPFESQRIYGNLVTVCGNRMQRRSVPPPSSATPRLGYWEPLVEGYGWLLTVVWPKPVSATFSS